MNREFVRELGTKRIELLTQKTKQKRIYFS